MCALLWRNMSWCHRFKISLCQTHLKVSKCDCRFPNQINSNSINSVWSLHPQVFKRICKKGSPLRWTCLHMSQPQVTTVCPSSTRSTGMEHRLSKHKLVRPCSLCISTNSSTSQTGTKSLPVKLPPHSGSPGSGDVVHYYH